MTFERLVGLFFFIGSILILVITFYPETNSYMVDDDITEDKNSSSNIKINSNNKLPNNFKNFSISDFDLFVYRAHVLRVFYHWLYLSEHYSDGYGHVSWACRDDLSSRNSQLLLRSSFYDEHIENNNITITEVNVSPDLKNAKVYVMPLGGEKKQDVLNSLNKATGRLKKIISSNLSLRKTPKLIFKIDETFEYAKKINDILDKIKK